MALLSALGESESGEDDVKGVLAEQGRAGEEEAVGGLLQEETAPQILGFVRHAYVGHSRLLKPGVQTHFRI